MSNLLPTVQIIFNATPNLVKTTMSPIMGFLPQRALKDNFVAYFLEVVIARLQIDWSRIDVTVVQEQLYPVGVGARPAKWIAKRCRKVCRWILPSLCALSTLLDDVVHVYERERKNGLIIPRFNA